MQHILSNLISPNYGPVKLESPTYGDLVDVFEDRILNWFFRPAKRLLETQHCQIAAVALLITYFEGTDAMIRQAFEDAAKLKWGLDEPDLAIGMTEKEFFET
jgi:hypothetical protein